VLGAGGLAAPAALALAAAGIRRLLLADDEPVAASDLVVQPLLAESDVGEPRVAALARALSRLHPRVEVVAEPRPLDAGAALELAREAEVAVEATSRFPAMFLWNDAAAAARVPLVHGAVLGHTAQLLTVVPGTSGCLRCLFEGPPPRPEAAPLGADPLGPFAGLVGSLLGLEATRLLEGQPGAYAGRLVVYEARSAWSRAVPLHPRPGCPACGANGAPVGEAA
jgi:molybdopterin/thiamine biosynthesis adenylyltransferase